jgi:hypothetical protein
MSESAQVINNFLAILTLCGGGALGYHIFTNDKKAKRILKEKYDSEIFYRNLEEGPYTEKLKYNVWPTRYVRNYIKKHPLQEREDTDVSSAMSEQSCPHASIM